MYFLRVKTNFSAAMYLANCDDSYKGMHGHDFAVSVTLKSDKLTSAGMVYDYNVVTDKLKEISKSLDHVLLNDKADFIECNPTVENLCKYFFDKLLEELVDLPIYDVRVCQSNGLSACFRPLG